MRTGAPTDCDDLICTFETKKLPDDNWASDNVSMRACFESVYNDGSIDESNGCFVGAAGGDEDVGTDEGSWSVEDAMYVS